jgi:hypothetical protein
MCNGAMGKTAWGRKRRGGDGKQVWPWLAPACSTRTIVFGSDPARAVPLPFYGDVSWLLWTLDYMRPAAVVCKLKLSCIQKKEKVEKLKLRSWVEIKLRIRILANQPALPSHSVQPILRISHLTSSSSLLYSSWTRQQHLEEIDREWRGWTGWMFGDHKNGRVGRCRREICD